MMWPKEETKGDLGDLGGLGDLARSRSSSTGEQLRVEGSRP